ncbi:GNAT family N-acetyltransferase, partial [Bacillus sp. D-CC]
FIEVKNIILPDGVVLTSLEKSENNK